MRAATLWTCFAVVLAGACAEREAPPGADSKGPAPSTASQDASPKPAGRDASAGDRITFGERLAREFARRKEEAKVAASLAAEEKARVMKYDRGKLAQHTALLAFIKKTRAQLDAAAAKLAGAPNAEQQMTKLAAGMRKALLAQAKALKAIDPKGGNSNIVTDHDACLNHLATDYPNAIVAAAAGDKAPLEDVRAEMDKRLKKIEAWLEEIKAK